MHKVLHSCSVPVSLIRKPDERIWKCDRSDRISGQNFLLRCKTQARGSVGRVSVSEACLLGNLKSLSKDFDCSAVHQKEPEEKSFIISHQMTRNNKDSSWTGRTRHSLLIRFSGRTFMQYWNPRRADEQKGSQGCNTSTLVTEMFKPLNYLQLAVAAFENLSWFRQLVQLNSVVYLSKFCIEHQNIN